MVDELTTDVIEERFENLTEHYAQRNENIMLWRRHYFEDPKVIFLDSNGNYIDPEPDEERTVLPLFRIMIDTMQELLLTKRPTISVPRSLVDANHNVQVDEIEKILYASWHHAYIYDQIVEAVWHGLTSGWGVLQTIYSPKKKSAGEFPIVVLAQDPMNVYPMPSDEPNQWEYVIHAYPRLVGSIRDDWVRGKDGRNKNVRVAKRTLDALKDTDEVTLVDYWDDTQNAVAIIYEVDSPGIGAKRTACEWIKPPANHNYGFLPWDIFFPCKLPFRNVGERMGVAFGHVVENLMKRLSQLASKKETFLSRNMDPPLVTKTADGRDFEPIRAERGMHIPLDTEEDVFYLEKKAPITLLDEEIALYMDVVERGSLPRALQGQQTGNISGIAMSLLRNPTLMKVAFKQDAIERTLENINDHILTLLEKYVTKPIYAWGVSPQGNGLEVMIDPEIIQGYHRNRVKLSASLPSDDASTVNMILSLLQGKVISSDTARDVAQQTLHDLLPQSLTDEAKKILAEGILAEPTFLLALAKQSAEEAGIPFPVNELLAGRNGGTPPGNPEYGDREVTMPPNTLPSQTPGMPGGNTEPNMDQRIQEMMMQQLQPQVSAEEPRRGVPVRRGPVA